MYGRISSKDAIKTGAACARIYWLKCLKHIENTLFSCPFPSRGKVGMGASVSANLPKSPILSTQSATEHDGTEPIPRGLTAAALASALACTGCSNFNSRERYWDDQLADKLKAAPL